MDNKDQVTPGSVVQPQVIHPTQTPQPPVEQPDVATQAQTLPSEQVFSTPQANDSLPQQPVQSPLEQPTLQQAQPTVSQQAAQPQVQPAVNSVPLPQATQLDQSQTATIPGSTSLPASMPPKSKLKSKILLPAVLAGFLVLGGSAAAYVAVFMKSPESMWKSALQNTATGVEAYLENGLNSPQKGFKTEGSFKVTSPVVVDGSMSGQWYESNGSLKADIGASGVRMNMDLVSNAKTAGATPDVYMKFSGLEGIDSLAASAGTPELAGIGSAISSLNDQWYFIDHTLIDQALASSAGQPEISQEEMKKIADNMMAVLKDRMFSTAEDKAVFKIAEKVGEEEFEGTDSYKMRVQVDQANFTAFIVALKDAGKGTKLEELVKMGQTDKTIEEILEFDMLIKELEKADFSKASADVWVEGNGMYIRNIRIYPDANKKESNYVDFGLKYEGGDVLPMLIRLTVDDGGTKGTLGFGFEINQKNADVKMTMNANMTSDQQAITAEASLSVVGSDEQVSPTVPSDAKSALELVAEMQSLLFGSSTMDTGSEFLIEEEFLYNDIPITDDTQL
jgi:hypothetical protein